VLVHHRDARLERITRGVEAHRLAPELDRACVGLVEAGQDVRERALACAVLAEQRMHLADGSLQLDGVVRQHAGKALGDAAHRHRRRRAGACGGVRALHARPVPVLVIRT
jgi:hypothetical protein